MVIKVAPKEPRLGYCFDVAWNIITELGISTFPVDPFQLLDKLSVRYCTIGEISKLTGYSRMDIMRSVIKSIDGGTLYVDGNIVVVYNERIRSTQRIRWTITHELAHIWLGHFDIPNLTSLSDEKRNVLDREADYVTKEVLAPLGLLGTLRITDSAGIRELCGLSKKAADIREGELRKLRDSRVYRLSTSYSCEHFQRFLTPISVCQDQNERRFTRMNSSPNGVVDIHYAVAKCRRCETEARGPHARYCIHCGAPLYNICAQPQQTPEPCGHINPQEARYCEMCGHETVFVALGIYERWQEEEEHYQPSFDDVPF